MTCWLTSHKHWDRMSHDVKPIYGSAGHIIDMPPAIECVLARVNEFRIPELVRAAQLAASKYKQAKADLVTAA